MGINRVFLIGNLGADPEVRYSQSQVAIANLRIATTERRKGADGNWADQTEWHRVVTLGKTAENCGQYLKKGRQVFIEGRIQTRKWQDKEGNDRYTTEVLAQTVEFLGGKGGGLSDNVEKGGFAGAPAGDVASFGGGSEAVAPVSFDDDDIPF